MTEATRHAVAGRMNQFGGIRPILGTSGRNKSSLDESDVLRLAFEAQMSSCWEPLWRYAFHLTSNTEDAADLLNEAVLEGYRGFAKFRGETSFLRWMYRVMTTTQIDMYRKNRRHDNLSLDLVCESAGDIFADEDANPAYIVMQSELSEPVHRALNSLPTDYRAVVVLADMEQLDYLEVSAILDIPLGTVRSRLHRARRMLRALLAPTIDPIVNGRAQLLRDTRRADT